MSEKETITQRTKNIILRTAIASLVIGMPALAIFVSRSFMHVFPDRLDLMLINIMGGLGMCGFVFGVFTVRRISCLATALAITALAISFYQTHMSNPFVHDASYRLMMSVLAYGSILLIFAVAVVCTVITKSKKSLSLGIITSVALLLNSAICAAWADLTHRYKLELPCHWNIWELGQAMEAYARDNNGRFPDPNSWCDVLLGNPRLSTEDFICPSIDIRDINHERLFFRPVPEVGKCHFAMNPDCGPNSPEDTVLLFEAGQGWNQFGGPEEVSTERHRKDGSMVVLKDGRTRIVYAETIAHLNWGDGKIRSAEGLVGRPTNARKPDSDEELQYWLKNMVWFYRFGNEEIRAATGLAKEEIDAALKKYDVRPDNGPKRAKDASLWVLPYPGGRHPRVGFLEGAIDPQRETKFCVLTPWDQNSYVVVDLPEAIWSNLGLIYLAHTHIDTIWSKQGIELPKLEWNRYRNGALDIERKLPNGIVFGAKVERTRAAVRMEMWLTNGTEQQLSDLRIQICVMTKMAAGFAQQTNDNKVFTNPYVACRSDDGKRWIITAWEGCHRPWGNAKCPCFHSDPKFPDLEPGETKRLRGWLSFYEGTDINAEFKRIEETGWRQP